MEEVSRTSGEEVEAGGSKGWMGHKTWLLRADARTPRARQAQAAVRYMFGRPAAVAGTWGLSELEGTAARLECARARAR